jgi:hypothetical protein
MKCCPLHDDTKICYSDETTAGEPLTKIKVLDIKKNFVKSELTIVDPEDSSEVFNFNGNR